MALYFIKLIKYQMVKDLARHLYVVFDGIRMVRHRLILRQGKQPKMYSNLIPSAQFTNFERRKDARKNVNGHPLVVADCQTMEGDFKAPINNISSGGIFIDTNQRLFVGQEIAIKFDFPGVRKAIMANGEIVRTSFDGAGIRFRMFFQK
jgi:hypothetical protein